MNANGARRPFSRRTSTLDNYHVAALQLDAARARCVPAGPGSAPLPIPIPMPQRCGVENAMQMQVDYPSPVEGAAFEWARPTTAHARY